MSQRERLINHKAYCNSDFAEIGLQTNFHQLRRYNDLNNHTLNVFTSLIEVVIILH